MRFVYIALCVVGTIAPLSQALPWLVEHGFDGMRLVDEVATDRLSATAWLDVIISALAFFVFVVTDARRNNVPKAWRAVLGTLVIGLSFGLPYYLLQRDRAVGGAD